MRTNKFINDLLERFETERREWASERKSLLDRIQFPEVRQIEPSQHEPAEQPKDSAELAYVGQEVPEFINVGTPNGGPDASTDH